VRVIAGSLGGRRLRAPPGRGTRPTSDRVREALFSILAPLDGLVVLDLFAGSGALGIEALSRGASAATFVEHAPRAVRTLQENLRELGLQAHVWRGDARAFVRDARADRRQYDLVLLDPPYRLGGELFAELDRELSGVLAPGARVVCECDRRAPLGLSAPPLETERRYGDTLIRIHGSHQPNRHMPRDI
jgi:16S rRNA (guanine966-N2)-methyltransferase